MFDKVLKKRRNKGRYCPYEQKCIRWKHRSHRRQKNAGSHYSDDRPLSNNLEPFKQKKRKHVQGLTTTTRAERDSYAESGEGCFGALKFWCFGRKAQRDLEREQKVRAKKAEEWRNWKYKEAERVAQAKHEAERRKREAEFVRQLHEINQEKAALEKQVAKTRYPYVVHKAKPPKEIFPKKKLSTTPYYPKNVKIKSSDDFITINGKKEKKRELKKIREEEKKVERKEKEIRHKERLFEKKQEKIQKEDEKNMKRKKKRMEKEEEKLNKDEIKRYKKQLEKLNNEEGKRSTLKKIRKNLMPHRNKEDEKYTEYEEIYDAPEKKKRSFTSYIRRSSQKKDTQYIEPYNYQYTPYTDPYIDSERQSYKEKKIPCTDTCKIKSESENDYITDTEYENDYNKLFTSEPKKMSRKEKKMKKKEEKLRNKYEKRMEKCERDRKRQENFVNGFYRVCCECLCCLSIIVMIGIAVVLYI